MHPAFGDVLGGMPEEKLSSKGSVTDHQGGGGEHHDDVDEDRLAVQVGRRER